MGILWIFLVFNKKEPWVGRCFLCGLFLCYDYFYYLCTRKYKRILTKVEKFGCLQPL